MNNRNSIIESLSYNRINESPKDLKVGDRFKVLRDISNFFLVNRDVWEVEQEPHTTSSDRPTLYYIIRKLKKDGTKASYMSGNNLFSMRKKDIDTMQTNGTIKVLEPNEPLTSGELNIEVIRTMIKDIGIDVMVGLSIAKIVSYKGSYIEIFLGESPKNLDAIRTKVLDTLKRNKISVSARGYYQVNKDHYIYIDRIQGD
jgi:hypothetical protein